jgi:hypothetical protein
VVPDNSDPQGFLFPRNIGKHSENLSDNIDYLIDSIF